LPKSLFIGIDEIAVPESEVTDPVDVGSLATVHGLEIVEMVYSSLNARDGWL
jgi:hypothetical protein